MSCGNPLNGGIDLGRQPRIASDFRNGSLSIAQVTQLDGNEFIQIAESETGDFVVIGKIGSHAFAF